MINPEAVSDFAKLIQKRIPKWEHIVAKDARWAYHYALVVGKFELGEPSISKNLEYACYYAEYVLNGAFPAAEKIIAKNAEEASYYAICITGKRFFKAEKIIKNSKHKLQYEEYFKIKL